MAEPSSTSGGARNEIPAPVTAWLETALAGRVTHKERFVSRREGWLVDIACESGDVLKGFLRLERFAGGQLKQPSCQGRRETAVVHRALPDVP